MTADTPRERFLTGADPGFAPLARELDRLIGAAAPALVPRLAYGMLVYSLGTDKRHWVVAIDVRPRVVVLRFLWGTLLHDPRGVLRGGTSTLMNLDVTSPAGLDADLVTDLVTQAVARYPDFKAAQAAG